MITKPRDSAKQTPRTDSLAHRKLSAAAGFVGNGAVEELEHLETELAARAEALEKAEAKCLSLAQDYIGMCDVVRDKDKCIADLERECAETCEDCDHGIRGGKVCESCLGTGTVTYRALYEATAQHVKELIEEIISVQKMA